MQTLQMVYSRLFPRKMWSTMTSNRKQTESQLLVLGCVQLGGNNILFGGGPTSKCRFLVCASAPTISPAYSPYHTKYAREKARGVLLFACHVSMRSSTYISISHVILRRREIGEYIDPRILVCLSIVSNVFCRVMQLCKHEVLRNSSNSNFVKQLWSSHFRRSYCDEIWRISRIYFTVDIKREIMSLPWTTGEILSFIIFITNHKFFPRVSLFYRRASKLYFILAERTK